MASEADTYVLSFPTERNGENKHANSRLTAFSTALGLAIALAASVAMAQRPDKPRPFSCTVAADQRTQKAGCYVTATEVLDSLPPGPVFWQLYRYPTIQAARRAKGASTGTVVKSLGKVRLFKIAPADWRLESGERVAVIGPLPVLPPRNTRRVIWKALCRQRRASTPLFIVIPV